MNSNDSWQSIIKDLESIEKESSEYFEIVRSRVFPKLLGFLKDDNNQKTLQSYSILEETQQLEEQLFGTRTHLDMVQEYTSGSQMLYEAFLSLCNNFLEVMPKRQHITLKEIVNVIQLALSIPMLTSRIMGQYDLLEVSNEVQEELRICTQNIENIAHEKHMLYHELLWYVVIHEEIHNWQSKIFNINLLMKDLIQRNDEQSLANLMICLEGHAEFFANMFAEKLIPEFEFKRNKPSFWTSIKYRILGLDKQMDRYVKGEKFIRILYEQGGILMVNKIFKIIPTQDEIEFMPFTYMQRVDPGLQIRNRVDLHN